MYTLIIVDDEERVRTGLQEFIDWEAIGFEIIGIFASGEEAVNFLVNHPVDVTLIDIIMPPGKNGLEIIEELNELKDRSIKIVLSGHTEFRYAKQALRLGARGFLTKPVDFKELNDLFLNFKEELDQKEIKKMDTMVQEELLVAETLSKLISGKYDDLQSITTKLWTYNICLEDSFGIILRIRLKQQINPNSGDVIYNKEFLDKIKDIWINQCQNIGYVVSFVNERNEIVIIINKNKKLEESFISKVCKNIENQFCVVSYIGSASYINLSDIDNAYLKTMQALSYRLINGKYIEYERISDNTYEVAVLEDKTKNLVIDYLYKKQFSELDKLLNEILEETVNIGKVNINAIYNICINLLLILNNYIIGFIGIQVIDENMAVLSQSLYQADTVKELSIKLSTYFNKAYDLINNHEYDQSGRIIEEIKLYITNHYDENISLQLLADMKYIHPIYLCKLFKEKVGCNFLEYLTKVRIEKSKMFLRDLGFKVYQISDMVGYDSPKYFSKVFKRYTGMTPKEYRNSMR